MTSFDEELAHRTIELRKNASLRETADAFMKTSIEAKYSYSFKWMGRPIIQYPQDILAMQEILWTVRPDLVIETGIAHGGSLVYYASFCELMGHGEVLGIDIDIRAHNRSAIEAHPMAHRIRMIQGSSIAPDVVDEVRSIAQGKRVLVVLDSNHTHDHVLAELDAYAPLVSVGSYCVVFDTIVEKLPRGTYPDRPWEVGNNPMTAVREFLSRNDQFEIDQDTEARIQITVAPGGYLRRIR
jgi:cephalosporin hydroxylase